MKSVIFAMLLSVSAFADPFQVKSNVAAGATGSLYPIVTLTVTPNPVGAAPASFNYYRSLTSGGCTGVGNGAPVPSGCTLVGNSPTIPFVDTTVTWATTYSYLATEVGSGCPSGTSCEGPPSPQATTTTAQNPVPGAPTALSATVTVAGNVNLEWKAPKPPVYAYRLYRKPATKTEFVMVKADIQATKVTDDPGRGEFDYDVRAVAYSGGEPSPASNVVAVNVTK